MPLVSFADDRILGRPVPVPSSPVRALIDHEGAAMKYSTDNNTVAAAASISEFAALPWRMNCDGRMEVLLLRPRQGGRWSLPTGRRSGTRTGLQSAERAAFQDAGVTGRLGTESLGRYRAIRVLPSGREVTCDVTVFGLHVCGTLVSWPGDTKVLRRWMSLTEATTLVTEARLATVLASVGSGATVSLTSRQASKAHDAAPYRRVPGVALPAGTARFDAC